MNEWMETDKQTIGFDSSWKPKMKNPNFIKSRTSFNQSEIQAKGTTHGIQESWTTWEGKRTYMQVQVDKSKASRSSKDKKPEGKDSWEIEISLDSVNDLRALTLSLRESRM